MSLARDALIFKKNTDVKKQKQKEQDSSKLLYLPWFAENIGSGKENMGEIYRVCNEERNKILHKNFNINKINMKDKIINFLTSALFYIAEGIARLWEMKRNGVKIGLCIVFIVIAYLLYKNSVAITATPNFEGLQESQKQLIEYKEELDTVKKKEKNINMIQEEIKKEKTETEKYRECLMQQIQRILEDKPTEAGYCKTYKLHAKEEKKPVSEDFKIIRKGWAIDDERQKIINYVYEKGGADGLDMVLTWTGENGLWTTDRKSIEDGRSGHKAYWICQVYWTYHKEWIQSEDFKDPYKQVDYCIGVWKDAKKKGTIYTTFQAYSWRNLNRTLFEIKES